MNRTLRPSSYLLLILFFIPCVIIFTATIRGADHYAHILFAQEAITTGKYPPHFLYDFVLNLFTGFSGNTNYLVTASILLLSLAVVFKLALSSFFIDHILNKYKVAISPLHQLLVLVTLFFIGPIINWWQFPIVYRGQFTPTLWHNPTSIFAIPFILGAFFLLACNTTTKKSIIGSILLALSILIKPNFALAFLPVLFMMALVKKTSWKTFFIACIPACLALAWQFDQNYTASGSMTISHHKSSIIFSPFKVWMHWNQTPVGSLLVSFAFPALFLYFFYNQIKNKALILWAWLLVGVSMTQFILLAEGGEKMFHGNFYWGIVPALYILFLATIIELLLLKPTPTNRWFRLQRNMCFAILALHVLSGIFFYWRIYSGNAYYA